MANLFSNVKKAKVPRTAFNLSHEVKCTLDLGKLTPVLCQEVLPGDKFNIRSEALVKLAPLIFPIMHRVNCYIHYFFVPNRILWSDWQDFITNNKELTCPYFQAQKGDFSKHTLGDYLGLPYMPDMAGETAIKVNELPFRAYFKIWNDYYRDENLQLEIDINNLSTEQRRILMYSSWEKDYFTSALPWTQKGDPVKIPLDGQLTFNRITTGGVTSDFPTSATTVQGLKEGDIGHLKLAGDPAGTNIGISETELDINDLRLSNRLQMWLERNARAGSRYVEHLLAHWGVVSKDASLQRAEYIGGGVAPVVISDVMQTSESATTPLGTPAGHGISVGNKFQANKFVDEHGFIFGIMRIVPKPAYYQGLPKMMFREVNTDFYYPEFANLGEQPVLNKELYLQGNTDDELEFGYQSRFAEYKYSSDRVHGEYKDSLEAFHLGRKFSNLPALNQNFVAMSEAGDLEARVFSAGRDAHPFWVQLYHNIIASRPMPFYGTPTL